MVETIALWNEIKQDYNGTILLAELPRPKGRWFTAFFANDIINLVKTANETANVAR